jgi:hypothetical protein
MRFCVDGYRVCDAVLKANDAIRLSLVNKHFERLEQPEDDVFIVHSATEEHEAPVTEVVDGGGGDGEEDGEPQRMYRLVKSPCDYGNRANETSIRAYWAHRSAEASFTLNTSLFYVLSHYKAAGYRNVVFGETSLSLDDLAPRIIVVEPSRRVYFDRRDDDKEKKKEVVFVCLTLGNYTLDLSAGQFWRFDEALRPLLFKPHAEFARTLGRFVKELPTKGVSYELNKMFDENTDNVIDGASVYKLALMHLGLTLDHNCPVRFRGQEIITQQKKLMALRVIASGSFQKLVEQYMQKSASPLAQTVNALGACADAVEKGEVTVNEDGLEVPDAVDPAEQHTLLQARSCDLCDHPVKVLPKRCLPVNHYTSANRLCRYHHREYLEDNRDSDRLLEENPYVCKQCQLEPT